MEKVDVLALGVHPDDIELGCSGTLLKCINQGLTIGLCDLTAGELGTRGSAELRLVESEKAKEILGARFRVNLGMADGFFENNEINQRKIIEVIRASKPRILLCNAIRDRHPDHGRSAELQKVAAFLSGLRKIETFHNGLQQDAWRPEIVLHYIQDNYIDPDLVIDVTAFWEKKMEAILSFSSQFYNPLSTEPMSSISSQEFLGVVEGRGLQMGRHINVKYGEGFTTSRPLGVESLKDLV